MAMKRCPDCGEKYSDTYKLLPLLRGGRRVSAGERAQAHRGASGRRQGRHLSLLSPDAGRR